MTALPTLHAVDLTPPPPAATGALQECVDIYRRYLHLPNPGRLYMALGTVAANLLDGDPVWLLLVEPPASGKTETIGPLAGLEYVHQAATITEPALLSGTPKKEHDASARGGLLRRIGDFGIILVKDFGSVLSMHRDARSSALAALREIYDGSWHRHVGTSGGLLLEWVGKCGLIGAVTPAIDQHHAVMATLGERFLLYRHDGGREDRLEQAMRRLGNNDVVGMRRDLTDAARRVLDLVEPHRPVPLAEDEKERIVALANIVTAARTGVDRDGYSHDVLVMPQWEGPARLAAGLGQLLAGLRAIGLEDCASWRLLAKTARDCVPPLRAQILDVLAAGGEGQKVAHVIEATGIPRKTAARVIEDLALLKLVHRWKDGAHDNAPWLLALAGLAAQRWPNLAVGPKRQGDE